MWLGRLGWEVFEDSVADDVQTGLANKTLARTVVNEFTDHEPIVIRVIGPAL